MTAVRRRLRVLVVEDDPRVRSLVADILETIADVQSTAGVDEAGKIFTGVPRRHFDLVVVDCLLPGPDGRVEPHGIDFMGEIHAQRPALPILAITGVGNVEAITVAAFRNGARDLLHKPFGIDDFRASVARLTLRTRRREAPPRTRAGVARVLNFLADAVGMPLRAYVRNLRLERAQQMLARSPETSVTDVALDAGFYDLPHFDKAFRERYGVSPSEFRKTKQTHHPA